MRKDRQGRSADGAADADLLRAFAYQYQHDVADAHDAREQRAQTYDPRKQGDASEEPHDLAEDLGGVLKIDRLLVVGGDQVPCGDALPALLDHLLGRFVRILR